MKKILKTNGFKAGLLILVFCAMVLAASIQTSAENLSAYAEQPISNNVSLDTSVVWLDDHLFMGNIVGIDGGYVVDATSGAAAGFLRTLTKYNFDDEAVWTINRTGITDFAPANDGGIFVVGNTGPWAASIGYLAKYLDGDLVWEISFDTFITHSQLNNIPADQFDMNARAITIIENNIFIGAMYTRGEYEITFDNGDTETLSRIHQNGGLNVCILKFDIEGNLHGLKNIASETANSIRVDQLDALENGTLVVSGILNTTGVGTATNIPNLYSRGGHDAYIMVLDTDLEQIGVRMMHSSGNLDAGNRMNVYGNDIFVSLMTGPRGGAASIHSLLLLSQEEQDTWPAGELLWQSGDGVLVGFNGDNIEGSTLFVHINPEAVASGATRDGDENLIVIYTVSQGSGQYSHIIKYDNYFDVMWESILGEVTNETRVQVISHVHGAIKAAGSANHRFDADEVTTALFDGFIYKIGNYDIEILIAAPYVEGIFIFGENMPKMQGYAARVNGVFSWIEGQMLQIGENQYAWKFTPNNPRFESVFGYILIYAHRADQAMPTAALTVTGVTINTIEFYPIEGAEFSIDNGATWQTSPLFEGLTPSTNFLATFRISQTPTHNASPQVESIIVSTLAAINVIYKSEGAQIGTTQVLSDLENRKIPENPIKAGYRFIGWEQSSSFINDRWVFVFEALWLREISVVFMNDGQQIGETQIVVRLEDATLPSVTQRDGYIFSWQIGTTDNTVIFTAIWTPQNQSGNQITIAAWVLLGFSIALAAATLLLFILASRKRRKNSN